MRRFASLKDSVGPRKIKSQHLNTHQFYQQNESFEVFSTKKWQQQPILSTAALGRQGTHFCALNKLQLQFLCWSIWTQTERVILNKTHDTEVKQRRVISNPTPITNRPLPAHQCPPKFHPVLKENKKLQLLTVRQLFSPPSHSYRKGQRTSIKKLLFSHISHHVVPPLLLLPPSL